MKIVFLVVIFLLSICYCYSQNEIGIYSVVDERSKIDYSQLFVNYFVESPLIYNDEKLNPILVNHYSQSNRSFKFNITSLSDCSDATVCDKLSLTLYENGKKIFNKNLDSNCLSLNVISEKPVYSMEFEEIENNVYRIVNIPEGSPENKAKLVVGEFFKLDYVLGETTFLKVKKDLETKKWKTKKLELPIDGTYNLKSNIELRDLDCLFHEIKKTLIEKFDLTSKSSKIKELTITSNIRDLIPTEGREYPSIYLPGKYQNIISKEPQIEFIELFEKEKFVLSENKKLNKLLSAEIGNSSLLNLAYYNKNNLDHKLHNQKEVSEALIDLIDLYILPFHNKPGFIINYINSGDEYFDNKNYKAALNQYNAAFKKINSANASSKVKTNLHYIISKKLAQAYKNTGMNSFSKLMETTSKLYKYSYDNWSHNDRYYTSIDTLLMIVERVEDQVRQKKKKRLWGVVKGVAAVSAGSAIAGTSGLSEFGLDMATEFVTTGIQVLNDDFKIASEISNSIEIMTNSLDIDSDAFDEQNDGLNIELNFLKALIEVIDKNKNDQALLSILQNSFSNESVLLNLVRKLELSDNLLSDINMKVLKQIGTIEKNIFNYEVRNFELPEKFQL